MQKARIADMTWVDNEVAFKKRKLAIVPVGSTEQHGPALPVGTDWMIAEYLANNAGKYISEALVTPVIPFGNASYHSDFPGTLSVSSDILTLYVKDICKNLVKYGATHIMFINGHGGNMNPLNDVGQYFRCKGIPVANVQWFDIAGHINKNWGLLGHGDIVETALMLAINPDLVFMERTQIPVNKKIGNIELQDLHRGKFMDGYVYLNIRTKDVSDTGDLLEYGHFADADYSVSPRDATAEMGMQIIKAVTDYIISFAKEFIQIKFNPLELQ